MMKMKMKMYEVLSMIAKGKVEHGSILKIVNEYDELYRYEYHKLYRGFKSEVGDGIEEDFSFDKDFLNIEVELIPPKEKKYRLKLYKEDDLSYMTRSPYVDIFSYSVSDKNETRNFITKFTQEEIDNDVLLKFIEQHGIKEEVEDNESMDS